MKTVRWNKISGLIFAAGLFAALHFARAQTTADTGSAVMTDPNTDVSNLSDLEVELKALEMATPIAASNEPSVGNFYSAQHAPGSAEEWPPLPGNIFGLPVWPLDTNIFVIDDLGFRYNESSAKTSQTANGIEAEDDFVVPSPPGGGSDTNTYNPPILTDLMPDYGTNLFVETLSMVSGNLTGIASNTIADVEYAIQTNSDLTTTNWADNGQFILGSETTNWTQFILPPPPTTNNLFFRLQSWASSDGSGLPTWWELKYLGQDTNVDPYADLTGDGWTLLDDFQNGWNPNTFQTPPAPPGLTVNYNASGGTAIINWLQSPGAVTGYTVEKTDSNAGTVNDFNVSASTTSYQDSLSGDTLNPYIGNIYAVSYRIRANYTNGTSSAWSVSVPLQPTTVFAAIVPGAGGTTELAVSGVPANAATVRLLFIDQSALGNGDTSFDYTENIPFSSLTNGLYQLPTAWQPPETDAYGESDYATYVESVDTNGNAEGVSYIYPDVWNTPFYDGRVQLKQNLIFQLREASVSDTFGIGPTNLSFYYSPFYSTNYAESSYNLMGDEDTLSPFKWNYYYRNFVFDPDALSNLGVVTNGVSFFGADELGIPVADFTVLESPVYQFETPQNGETNFPALLGTNSTEWLVTSPYFTWEDPQDFGITYANNYNDFVIAENARNLYGLPYLSEKIAQSALPTNLLSDDVLTADGSLPINQEALFDFFYPDPAQPGFQTVEYDFWNGANMDTPGNASFSTTNTSDLLIAGVGNDVQMSGYAKLAVTNGYSGVYGYLGQYFDQAYQFDTNGNVTTNIAGVLSPYGSFFPTVAGPAAVVTMPDPDTGEQGTGIVNCVSLNVDKNHDGTMDTSFNGPDTTSSTSPMDFWVNSGYSGVDGDAPVMTGVLADYTFGNITCPRDLENFARLWICGMPALTNGYQVTLNWANVSSGNPGINLYESVETNGGTGYLTDTNIALAQSEFSFSGSSPYSLVKTGIGVAIAELTNGASFTFPADYFTNSGNKYLLFEGAGIGTGELQLSVIDNNSNAIAQTGVWLDLHDITDFYELAEATNVTAGLPPSTLVSQFESIREVPAHQNESKQMVVFVHGINNTDFTAQDATEIIYKRMYWSGYNGRVCEFKWPCAFLPFDNTLNPFNYNLGEFYAWKSATALKNYLSYLKNRPDLAGYQINILAHSQGNIVASEAVRLGAPFDNYILTQGAAPAHSYDTSVPFLPALLNAESLYPTPFYPTNGGYNGYFSGLTGNFINFYNINDYALASGTWNGLQANWVADQISQKPEDYGYRGGQTYSYYPSTFTTSAGYSFTDYTVTDPYEIMSQVARSRTSAVGAQANVGGIMNTNLSVDLRVAFQFGNTRAEHSAQFTRPIQSVLGYYQTLLNRIQPAQ